MDWKVKRRRMDNLSEPKSESFSEEKSTPRIGASTRPKTSKSRIHLFSIGVILIVLCQSLTPVSCFFFPKSLFRRLSPAQQQQQQQQQHTAPSRDSRLVASPSDQQQQIIQPGVRIVNNRPFGNEPPSQPNPNFHVPKALCIACEKFPWMPVAGSDQTPQQSQGQGQGQPDQYPAKSVNNPEVQPPNTIVISALGEAKDPVSLPPQTANRKPFAIQFDSVQSQNNAGPAPPPQQQQTVQNTKQQFKEYTPTEENKNRDPATRPITFQIYDPPRQQPTVLRPVGGQQQQGGGGGGGGGYFNEPAPFMQPPPSQGYQFRPPVQNSQQMFFQPQLSYRPTILQPVSQSYGMIPPPPPVQVQQQQQQQGGGYNFPPRNVPQQQQQQQPQKQPKFVDPPSGNNGPIPPITISTIVAAQHGGGGGQPHPQQQQQFSQGPTTFHGIVPAKLVYQEHSEVHQQKNAPFKNQPQIQYGKPFPPPSPPQMFQMPLMHRPFGQQQRPQNHGGYLPPPPQNRPPQGTYLPPQSQSGGGKSVGNQYIINLRPPMQQNLGGSGGYAQPGQRPPPGQIYFPNQVQVQQQNPKQFGPPPPPQQPSGGNGNQGSNDVKYGQPQPNQAPQSSNIVPIPVPSSESTASGDQYHQSGSNIQNQRENPSNNFLPPPPPASGSVSKVPFNPPKGVVKNPHIQSIENVQPPQPPRESGNNVNPTTVATTQENGWEIIPAVQTDITHLFQNPPKPTEQTKEVQQTPVKHPQVIPLPVPIPIPESHASKSPVFVVRNQGNRPLSQNDPKIHGNIVVQGITYHEEQKNKQGQSQPQPQPQSSQQSTQSAPPPGQNVPYNNNQQQQQNVPPSPQVQSQQPQVQPPLHPQQFMLRPQPGSQFDPLPASISTALYHAQRTSYLTHQYWQSNSNANGNGGPGGRTVYVHSVPVVRPAYPQVQVSHSNAIGSEGGRDSSSPVASDSNINSVEGDPVEQENKENNSPVSADQTTVNCQNHQQWVHAHPPNQQQQLSPSPSIQQQQVQQPQQQQQPYLMYYRPPPPPVQQQQSSIFWIQPPQQPIGVMRHHPQQQQQQHQQQQQSPIGDESRPVFSKPVYARVVGQSQSHTVNENNQPQEEDTKSQSSAGSGSNNQDANNEKGSSEEQSAYSINIPFGEKLSKRPTVTPFDIISVGGTKDDSQVQSLEEENGDQQSNNYNSNSNTDYHQPQPQPQEPGSSEQGAYDGQEVSQEVSQDNNNEGGSGSSSPDEQNALTDFHSQSGESGNKPQNGPDFGNRPPTPNPNYILRPVSTTIIHSPESSSYSSQTFGSQGFRPQKVIVHDFTKGESSSNSNRDEDSPPVPSASFSAPQEETYGQPSQNVHSWQSINGAVRPKSPKLVEKYQTDDEEEDKQSLASVSNSKIVKYQSLATGLMTPAECATAHSHAILLTQPQNTGEGQGRIVELSPGKNGQRVDKVRYNLGTRFPAGRPAVTSFNAWTTTSTTTTTPIPVDYEQGSLENGDHHSQHPGGSASISIPVYHPPNQETPSYHLSHTRFTNNKWSPPKNVILDDIYATSEVKQQSLETGGIGPITTISTDQDEQVSSISPATSTTVTAVTLTEPITTMSTEKSSSFSISMKSGSGSEAEPTARKVPSGSDGQKLEIRFSPSLDVERPVFIVTSAPVPTTSSEETTVVSDPTTPSPQSTSTKIIKTVRVRQRMRPGSFGVKNRFNGNGTTRVRVVHRPVVPEYVRHFPELSTAENEKLGKHEEEEIKNALIELQRTDRAKL